MNEERLEQIVNAVLYEGYILYPYRFSSRKNQRERFTFGRVYPEAFSIWRQGVEPSAMQTEVLFMILDERAILSGSVRFLQPLWREAGGRRWQEAVERRVQFSVSELSRDEKTVRQIPFSFPAERISEPDEAAEPGGRMTLRSVEEMQGAIDLTAQPLDAGLHKITLRVLNVTPMTEPEVGDPDGVIMRTFTSTHTVLHLEGGEFLSLMDPAPEHKGAADGCANLGTWPVMVGDEKKQERDTMLSSPIILYDYPQIATESAGPLFDGTEIDEILTLRVLAMSDEEKREIRSAEMQARQLLERTESIGAEEIMRLHGRLRESEATKDRATGQGAAAAESSPAAPVDFDDFFGAAAPLESVLVGGERLKAGDRVRLKPKARADAIDLALAGQTAVIESVQQDMEGRTYLAVVLENDPGKDLGLMRQPGHRFFYGVEEVELLPAGCEAKV